MQQTFPRLSATNRRVFLLGGASLALTGCANMRFPTTPVAQEALLETDEGQDLKFIEVTTENIGLVRTPKLSAGRVSSNPPPQGQRYAYRVGVGDQLRIDFFADPSRVSETSEVTPSNTPVIDETGTFFYPFVGSVRASGRTIGQIREDLVTQLERFFATPQVDISVIGFAGRRATITGAVGGQGNRVLTNVPLTLLDLVNEAGPAPDADLRQIVIQRGGRQYRVNLEAFLTSGVPTMNPVVLDGDLIRVPLRDDNKVFTFGEIATGEVPLVPQSRKTLVEVLAEVGGIDRLRADARGIFVFRRDDPARTGFDVYQFNLRDASALILAAEFEMAPLDIVFVTNDPATRWSDTVGKIVQPFDSLVRARNTANTLSE